MQKFEYRAKNNQGEERQGEMEAMNEKEVAESLRQDGFWPISIEVVREKKKKSSFAGRFLSVPLKNRMIFCRHLAVMISSGVSLSRALIILAEQERNKTFQRVIRKIASEVKEGISLADAIAKYPGIFNQVFISMVRVGEIGGNLEEILKILSDQLEKDHKLISKVRGALIYPAIIIAVMIGIGTLMMMFVVPKISAIFVEFGAELPILTKIVIGISNFMANNVLITLGTMAGVVIGTRMFAKTLPGKMFFHRIFLKAPVVGGIVTKVNSARFARILSSLLNSGVSMVKALKITSDTLGNYYFKRATQQAAADIQRGIPLSKVIASYDKYFPYLVIQMVEVGEETGKTPEILIKLAEFYEEEVDQITKNLSSVIEPVLMVVIGAAVGLFAIAIIQPIYSIMNNV